MESEFLNRSKSEHWKPREAGIGVFAFFDLRLNLSPRAADAQMSLTLQKPRFQKLFAGADAKFP